MRASILVTVLVLTGWAANAAQLKGKSLNNVKMPAELHLDKGQPIKGSVRFGKGKKASFRAHDGTEVAIRVRPICAHGAIDKVDECWPNLSIELDDLSSRTGTLKIFEEQKKK